MDASPDIFSSRDQTRTSPVLYRERQSKIRAFYDACSVANIPRGVLDTRVNPDTCQPRPQGLLASQYGGGRRGDPGTQRTKTIADWCIPLRVHTCALIGSFLPKQRWLPFEGFVEA